MSARHAAGAPLHAKQPEPQPAGNVHYALSRSLVQYRPTNDITYPNGSERDQGISGPYRVGGIPTTLVIDRQGRIRWQWPGEIQTRRLYAVIEELLR